MALCMYLLLLSCLFNAWPLFQKETGGANAPEFSGDGVIQIVGMRIWLFMGVDYDRLWDDCWMSGVLERGGGERGKSIYCDMYLISRYLRVSYVPDCQNFLAPFDVSYLTVFK